MLRPPTLDWDAQPGSLYTVAYVDVDIPTALLGLPEGGNFGFWHMLVTNVPGKQVEKGDVNFRYVPSQTFNAVPGSEPGKLRVDENPAYTHRYLILVFEQEGRIDLPLGEDFCQEETVKRVVVSESCNSYTPSA